MVRIVRSGFNDQKDTSTVKTVHWRPVAETELIDDSSPAASVTDPVQTTA